MQTIEEKVQAWKDIVLEYNIEEDSIYHSTQEVTQYFGLPQKIECVQDYLLRYGVIQPESAKEFLNLFRAIRGGTPHAECVVRARTAQGNLIWAHMALTTVHTEDGPPVRAVGTLKDVTAWREAELQWHNNQQHQDIMMREALIYYEANLTQRTMTLGLEWLMKTAQTGSMQSYETALVLLTDTVVHPEDRIAVRTFLAVDALLARHANGDTRADLEYRRLTGEGTVLWVRGSAYLAQNTLSGDVMLYFYVSNINEQKLRELSLRERVERDALTGLYNKVTTELRIREAIATDRAQIKTGAVLLVGLRGFREVNERRGHYFGDALLSTLGRELGEACKANDLVGRCSGISFMAYLRNVQDAADAMRRAGMLCTRGKYVLRESGVALTIGIALCPEHGDCLEILHRKADLALAACKHGGPVRVYSDCMHKGFHNIPAQARDADEPLMEESVIEHVFRALYESQDLDRAIQSVLELLMDAFGFHRGYVFDVQVDGSAQCTFESRAPGILSAPKERYTMNEQQVEQCESLFTASDIYFSRSPELVATDSTLLALRVLCGFHNAEKLRGFVGFTRVGADDRFSEKQMASLQNVMRLLGMFLGGRALNRDLRESSLLLQSIVNGMHTCTYIIDPETHIIKYINQNTQKLMPGAVPGRRCHEVLRGNIRPCEDCPIDRMVRDGTQEDRSQMYLEQFRVWARVNASLVTVPDGQVLGVFNSFDFSDERHESGPGTDVSDFTHDTSLYDALSVSTDDYIIMCDMTTNRFYFPEKMVKEFELPSQVIEDAVPLWAEYVHQEDREEFLSDIRDMFLGKKDSHSQEYRAKNKWGEWVWLRAKGHVERNKDGEPTLFAVVLTNLGRKSKVDHLTGLLDKYEFEMSTRACMAKGLKRGALLLLGLDNFRYINNIYGWDFGDSVLKESSLRLLSTLPEKMQLYRLDGDKFGVFFPNADMEAVKEYYQSLFHVFRQHRQFGGHRYYCTVSAGCAFFSGEDTTFGTLYKQAICAMDASKRDGKNRLTIYDEKTMGGNERVLAVMAALHESIESGCKGFALYYQPQIDPKTGTVHSAEALLRWRHSELGMVSPAEFVPLIEQTGLIHRMGRWVIQQASDVCRKWRCVVPDFTVSVNLSFAQLQDQSFLPFLAKQAGKRALDPGMLHLEITESCIVDGSHQLGEAVQKLRAMGFLIEMDDFGTGYSSLEILKNAPADVVKIDQAFVRDITRSKFDATFIQIIVDLCHSVDIRVCLEGVETAEEYELVQPMKLDLMQGFFFGKPQSEQDFYENYIVPADS